MKNIFVLLLMFGCGLEPLSPLPTLGCKEMKPVCICDAQNHCEWQFECVRDD